MSTARPLLPSLALALALAPLPAAAQPAAWGKEPAAQAPAPAKKPRARAKAKPSASAEKARKASEARREQALADAAAERATITARAAELVETGGPEASARWLSGRAAATADPHVHLMAAETWLSVQGSGDIELGRAADHARDAARLADPALDPPRIADDDVAAIRDQSDAILRAVDTRRGAARQARRGRQELTAGAILLGVAAAGAGVIAGGASEHRKYHNRVDPLVGMEAMYDLTALEDRYDRGSTMVAAGAVMLIGGAVLGATLTGIGARDLRQGRRLRGQRAELRLAPTLGGLALHGRF